MEKGDVRECPDCASHNIVYSEVREQIICHDCGLIFEPFQAIEKPTSSLKMPVTLKQNKEVKKMAAKKKRKSSKKKSTKKSSKKKSKRR